MVELPPTLTGDAGSFILTQEPLMKAAGDLHMELDLRLLRNLLSKRTDEIEKSVAGTGYLTKTVIGVGTFLLDNEGDIDLMTDKQKVIFEKFILPLLDAPRR
jgi:hypothetical protein